MHLIVLPRHLYRKLTALHQLRVLDVLRKQDVPTYQSLTQPLNQHLVLLGDVVVAQATTELHYEQQMLNHVIVLQDQLNYVRLNHHVVMGAAG